MEALTLDGNAAAGILQQVFGAEMTTASEPATAAAPSGRSAPCASTARPGSSCAARTATPSC